MAIDRRVIDFFTQLPVYELLTFVEAYKAARDGKNLSKSAGEAGREISAYQRAIQALNGRAEKFFDEALLVKPSKKGKTWQPTPTGELFYGFCVELQECVLTNFSDLERFTLSRPIRIAMQQLSLMDVLRIEARIKERLRELNSRRHFQKRLEHVSSEQFPTILTTAPDMDFAFGGLINEEVLAPGLEFVEVEKRPYYLISNFDFAKAYKLSAQTPVDVSLLKKERVPLVIAHVGVIVDFLVGSLNEIRVRERDRASYLEQIRAAYNIVEECNDVHFVIELLCTTRQRLCMFGTLDIFQRAKERSRSSEVTSFCKEQNFDPRTLFYHAIAPDLPALRIGLIRRQPKGKLSSMYTPDHPMTLFWEAAVEHGSARSARKN